MIVLLAFQVRLDTMEFSNNQKKNNEHELK